MPNVVSPYKEVNSAARPVRRLRNVIRILRVKSTGYRVRPVRSVVGRVDHTSRRIGLARQRARKIVAVGERVRLACRDLVARLHIVYRIEASKVRGRVSVLHLRVTVGVLQAE